MRLRLTLEGLVRAASGLVSRRRLPLPGSLALGAAAALTDGGIVQEARAAPPVPAWLKVSGEEVRGYGLPSEKGQTLSVR